jgi:hypothetical protein
MIAAVRTGPALLLALLSACAADPSFVVRWQVDRSADLSSPTPLASVRDCTGSGIAHVRLDAFVMDAPAGLPPEASKTWSCFPGAFARDDGTVDGPELAPGLYRVTLTGVRSDGWEWPASDGEGGTTPYVFLGMDDVRVEEDAAPFRLQEIFDDDERDPVLRAPPQCEDGVDNDRDGWVDTLDPACRRADALLEDDSVTVSEYRVRVTFLDENPTIRGASHCAALGVRTVVLRNEEGADLVDPVSCVDALAGPITLTRTHGGTAETVYLTALDAAAQAVTAAVPLQLLPGGGSELHVDFDETVFLAPILHAMDFLLTLFPGLPGTCEPSPTSELGTLKIATVRLLLRGAHGETLAPAVSLEGGELLDGASDIACPLQLLRSEPLPWGGYLLEGEALSAGGETCLTAPPFITAPGTGGSFVLPFERVLPPPPSCVDCSSDDDCGSRRCSSDGLCVDCIDDADCPGAACVAGSCS